MGMVALPRSLATSLLVLGLGAPFVLVALAGHALVPRLSEASVALLLRVSAPLEVAASEPSPDPPLEADPPSEVMSHSSTPPAARRSAGRAVDKKPPAGLFVAQSTVLRLAQSSARPRGSFVGPDGSRPPGLRLSGVGGLGIGLEDGDILVEALGVSPRSPAEIIGAVIEARARRAAALSGTLWRRGHTFRITVEQPY